MEQTIKNILDRLLPGIESNGGTMELIGIDADGTICFRQAEDCESPEHIIWMHRLRLERAIRQEYPDAVVKVDMKS